MIPKQMIDVRIFGVPERIDNIYKNKSILNVPNDRVIIDYCHGGCAKTARMAWELPASSDHVLVLQDDVELSKNFLHYCEIIVNTHPDAIISLYPGGFPRVEHIKSLPKQTPYISTMEVSGPAIIMRADYIRPCLDTWDDNIKGDDIQIRNWAQEANILRLTTIPCIVQHIGAESVFDPSRSLGRSDFFIEDPSSVDWSERYFTPESNVKKR